ncbi:MAG: glucose-6-phosphate isomerase, partial [Pseudomonadota bacterium]
MTKFSELQAKAARVADRSILSLLDAERSADFSVTADGLLFDYAKTNIDAETRALLLDLAAPVAAARAAMFAGEKINEMEGRAVLHTALRSFAAPVYVDGVDVTEGIRETLAKMERFAAALRSGAFAGQGGQITDIVNIGIGGSDLGPVMAVAALSPYHDGPRAHFVSNVDGAHIADTLAGLDPQTTLVIVASKTFTTIETMTNAKTAWDWMA